MNMTNKAVAAALSAGLLIAAAAQPASAAILDGSFEVQGAAAQPGCTDVSCPQSPWNVVGRAGFNEVDEGPTQTADGSYFARIQAISSATGSISQTFSLTQGIYNLTFLSAGRSNSGFYDYFAFDGALTYDVLFDGASIFSETTSTGSTFAQQAVNGINVATSGLHTLTFASRGTGFDRDRTAFIDNVSLTAAVPEPGTWAMMLVGFGMIGAASRRRRRAAVTTYA